MSKFRLSHIKAKNVMGIPEVDQDVGDITIVSGKNGEGKTSFIELCRATGRGAKHDPTLLRKGAEKGVIEATFTNGYTVKKTITPTKTSVQIEKDGAVIKSPATFIKRTFDEMGLDPVSLLAKKPKEQIDAVLSALPIRVTEDQINKIVPDFPYKIDFNMHALTLLEKLIKEVFSSRTVTNKTAKEALATVESLSEQVQDIPEDISDIESEINSLNGEIEKERTRKDKAIEDERNLLEAQIKELGVAYEKAKGEIERRFMDCKVNYSEQIGALEQKKKHFDSAIATKKMIKDYQSYYDKAKQTSERQTKQIDALRKLKIEMASQLPIEGVSVENEMLHIDGVPFHRTNTQRQLEVLVKIAKLRMEETETIFVDNLECLDDKNFKIFCNLANKEGIQIIGARVSDENLTIENKTKIEDDIL